MLLAAVFGNRLRQEAETWTSAVFCYLTQEN